ncbi:hypothetical protein [Planktothricoides sp. SR001]|nr:hypothetical protein [Planktothricoides sp. SR001]
MAWGRETRYEKPGFLVAYQRWKKRSHLGDMRNRVSFRNSPKISARNMRNPVSCLGDRILGHEKPGFFSEFTKNLGKKHKKPGFLVASPHRISYNYYKCLDFDMETSLNLEYITNQDGEISAVVIPIDLWRKIIPNQEVSTEQLADAIEDYCMNKAMDEAVNTPLLDRSEALAYLEE